MKTTFPIPTFPEIVANIKHSVHLQHYSHVTYIPLVNGAWVQLSTFDFDRLVVLGMPCNDWFMDTDSDGVTPVVTAPSQNMGRSELVRVPDIIYGLSDCEQITYGTGGPLNLTRSNVTRLHQHEIKALSAGINQTSRRISRIERLKAKTDAGLRTWAARKGVVHFHPKNS